MLKGVVVWCEDLHGSHVGHSSVPLLLQGALLHTSD